MAAPPRHYFLNEKHELSHADKEGGGGRPKFGKIDWAKKGQILSSSIVSARNAMAKTPDPTTSDRLFLLATPVSSIPKKSDNKTKYPTGSFDERPSFAGEDSLVFRRLGIDLIDVGKTGEAVVHVPSQRLEKLLKTTAALDREGIREQARWAALDRFDVVPAHMKVDSEWLETLDKSQTSASIIRLHALLTRIEVEMVLRRIAETIFTDGESVVRVGRSFSGRPWFLARLRRKSIERIARDFPSVQAIHPPLRTELDSVQRKSAHGMKPRPVASPPSSSAPTGPLPTVAVLDCGIPKNHLLLSSFVRGRYAGRNSGALQGEDHASLVASRAVFGEVDFYGGIGIPPPGKVAIIDVAVADPVASSVGQPAIDDDDVVESMGLVVSGNPEARVFNLSFSGPPLNRLGPVERNQRLIHAQDLDNFIFANDVVVVMSAGNSLGGVQPTENYPAHVDDPRWALGPWASGINTLKCGAYVGHPVPTGLVNTIGWPSPFSRIGPPVSNAAAPEFSATGGDVGPNYQSTVGAGVWCCDSTGAWVDHPGTSFAAPLLAREAAFTCDRLQRIAGKPFAALVRAVMALTARRPGESTFTKSVSFLAERTLGRGFPDTSSITKPSADRALVFWQGILDGPGDIARVQLPLPIAWLSKAKAPRIRLLVSWDPPVNHAATDIWACREVTARVKASPNAGALAPSKNTKRRNSPLIDREYDLSADRLEEKGVEISDDMWVVEMFYEEVAAYPIGVTVSPVQRVAFVVEISDWGDPLAPLHDEIQKLRVSQAMTQLTSVSLPLPATLLVTVK